MTLDDQASALEQFQRDNALKIRKSVLQKVGACYNCGEHISKDRLFCDADCREDYEKRQ